MIGKSGLISGLYFLRTNNSKSHDSLLRSCNTLNYCNSVSHNNNAKLWHHPLKHLFDSMLRNVTNKIQIIVPTDFGSNKCIICHLAKLKRLPFKSANNFSPNVFYLNHCNLWDPFGKTTHDGKSYFITIVDYCS